MTDKLYDQLFSEDGLQGRRGLLGQTQKKVDGEIIVTIDNNPDCPLITFTANGTFNLGQLHALKREFAGMIDDMVVKACGGKDGGGNECYPLGSQPEPRS